MTLFIIVAIVVVALGVMAFIFWPNIQEVFMSEADASAYLAGQAPTLQSAVAYCVKDTSTYLLKEQSLHAGYYSYNHLYALDYAGPKLVVMYKDANSARVNELPSIPVIQNEFSSALEAEGYARIDSCLNNFADFKKKMDVTPGDRKITAEIHDETVTIKTDWPIVISKGNKASETLPQSDIELLMPLGRLWTVANDIVNSEANQTSFILNYESYIRAHDSTMKYTRLDMQNYPTSDQTVFLLRNVPSQPGEEEILFQFATDRA